MNSAIHLSYNRPQFSVSLVFPGINLEFQGTQGFFRTKIKIQGFPGFPGGRTTLTLVRRTSSDFKTPPSLLKILSFAMFFQFSLSVFGNRRKSFYSCLNYDTTARLQARFFLLRTISGQLACGKSVRPVSNAEYITITEVSLLSEPLMFLSPRPLSS